MFLGLPPYIPWLPLDISSRGSVLRAPTQLDYPNLPICVCWEVREPHACNRGVLLSEERESSKRMATMLHANQEMLLE